MLQPIPQCLSYPKPRMKRLNRVTGGNNYMPLTFICLWIMTG